MAGVRSAGRIGGARAHIGRGASALIGLLLATTDVVPGAVTLAWDQVVHPLRSGYVVYAGPARGSYTARQVVGDVTSRVFVGLDEGQTYHLAVTTYGSFYDESGYSSDVGATVPYRVLVADFSGSRPWAWCRSVRL